MSTQRLPAEWEPQDAVILTWPHKDTAWNWILEDVTELYEALTTVIVDYADVIIALPSNMIEEVYARLDMMGAPMDYIYLYPCDSDDTWTRDHGPITVESAQCFQLLDFQFNGWGNKVLQQIDNQISQQLFAQKVFPYASIEVQDWVLEGGSIESDGQGTLLTPSKCLLN